MPPSPGQTDSSSKETASRVPLAAKLRSVGTGSACGSAAARILAGRRIPLQLQRRLLSQLRTSWYSSAGAVAAAGLSRGSPLARPPAAPHLQRQLASGLQPGQPLQLLLSPQGSQLQPEKLSSSEVLAPESASGELPGSQALWLLGQSLRWSAQRHAAAVAAVPAVLALLACRGDDQ